MHLIVAVHFESGKSPNQFKIFLSIAIAIYFSIYDVANLMCGTLSKLLKSMNNASISPPLFNSDAKSCMSCINKLGFIEFIVLLKAIHA